MSAKKKTVQNSDWELDAEYITAKFPRNLHESMRYWLDRREVDIHWNLLDTLMHLNGKPWVYPLHLYSLLDLLGKKEYMPFVEDIWTKGPYFKGWDKWQPKKEGAGE